MMNKIKNIYKLLLELVWPLVGSGSEELLLLIVAFFLSPLTGHGVLVTWLYIWCAIAIIRIALYGDTIKERVE